MRPRALRHVILLFVLSFIPAISLADNVNGAWDSPEADNWPLNSMHVALTPDGRVLSYGSTGDGVGTAFFIYDVWDPAAGLSGGHVTLPNVTQTDIFCSTAVIIPDTGDILIAGGDTGDGTITTQLGNNKSTIYRASEMSLSNGPDMNLGRWYASVTPLLDGEIYVQGGKSGEILPEVRRLDGTFRLLDGAATGGYSWYYPRTFLAPDGRVFGIDTGGKMYYVDTTGGGSITPAGQLNSSLVGQPSTVAMFLPSKILLISANSDASTVIDFSGGAPVVTPAASLSSRRAWANATVLADGRVLVTGGSEVPNTLTGVNNRAEIWNPQTDTWTLGASGARPRLYHSSALLLPDGSVLVSGGGGTPASPVTNLHAEIYHPPYLYDESGQWAPRPTIDLAPDILAIGEAFDIVAGSSDQIARVTLVRASVASHSVNNTQNFVELGFSNSGGVLQAQMPVHPVDAPPGYYMLFVINTSGVPSRAKIVRINPQEGSGSATVSVPNVVGLIQSAAAAAITNVGLMLETVTQLSSATVPAGDVISQDPVADTTVAAGSAVNLVASSGPASASASVTPTSLAFGNQALKLASPGKSVTITNTGTIVLPISSISLKGNNPGQFTRSTNCPSQLPVGGTCTATVVFKPTSTGTKSANLTVTFGSGAANSTVALSGTGVNYAFSVSPTSLAFGNVARGNTSAAKSVTVTNTGTAALPITSITLAGSNPAQFSQTNNCPTQLSTGGKCTLTVRFKPTSAGSKSATLRVTPGGGAAAKTVTLSGTGT